jgi:hypothetical protein
MTNRENSFLTVIITILTTIASWIMSHHFASLTTADLEAKTQEKIDTVASQSSEKILNLSKQLFEIQLFLEEAVDIARDQDNVMAANATFAHRSESAAKMLYLLRSSNDTFTSDWIGVVSTDVAKRIDELKKAQSDIFRGMESVRQESRPELAPQHDAGAGLYRELTRLSEDAARLPDAIRPDIRIPAATVSQHITTSSQRHQEGILAITVLRPVFTVTGSGKLSPEMPTVPRMVARVQSTPEGQTIPEFGVHSGTGTRHDFHVHMKSKQFGQPLPPGKYVLHYTADAPAELHIEHHPLEGDSSQQNEG